MSKEILALLKGLLKKIMSHLEPPEPKGPASASRRRKSKNGE